MSVLPSAAVILICIGGFQPVASSFEMSAFSSGMISAPVVAIAQRRLRRDVGLRERVDHVLAVGRDLRPVCVPLSGVSETLFLPSSPIR